MVHSAKPFDLLWNGGDLMKRISRFDKKMRNSSETKLVALSVTTAIGRPSNLHANSKPAMNWEAETVVIRIIFRNFECESMIMM